MSIKNQKTKENYKNILHYFGLLGAVVPRTDELPEKTGSLIEYGRALGLSIILKSGRIKIK
tara:strand:- start:63 stop:245 length:183 start_codon:yes stop_codon:yes gene_type:complete